MFSIWTSHINDPEVKVNFQDQVKSAKPVLERAWDILDKHEKDLENSELSAKTYDLPNWDYRQAHNNGFKAGLRFAKRLLNLDQQKDVNSK